MKVCVHTRDELGIDIDGHRSWSTVQVTVASMVCVNLVDWCFGELYFQVYARQGSKKQLKNVT
jgi:hypothetical protein